MNTEIEYLYRDGCNAKIWTSIVLAGELDHAQQQILFSCCSHEFDDPQFVPLEVGLRVLGPVYDWDPAMDHPWHVLASVSQTDKPATVSAPMAAELLALFQARAGRWIGAEPPSSDRSAHEALAMRKNLVDLYAEVLGATRARELASIL